MPLLEIILLTGLVVFITHSLESVTGFGCSAIAIPFVIIIMGDIEKAKIILSILAWILALYFAITKFRQICWKEFRVIALFSLAGMPLGIFLFSHLDSDILTRLLGIFIAVSSTVQFYKTLRVRKRLGGEKQSGFWGYIYLFMGGIVHGAFATGGPLIILYSAEKLRDKSQFRATMCLLWAVLNTFLVIGYFAKDKITLELAEYVLYLLPFLVAGIITGEYLHRRIDGHMFRLVIFSTLALVGMIMIFT